MRPCPPRSNQPAPRPHTHSVSSVSPLRLVPHPPFGPWGSPLSSWPAASESLEGGGRGSSCHQLRERRVSGRQGWRSVPGDTARRGRRTRRRSPSYHTRAGRQGHPGRSRAARASPRGSFAPAGPGQPLPGDRRRRTGAGSVPHRPRRPERLPSVFPCVLRGTQDPGKVEATFPCTPGPTAQLRGHPRGVSGPRREVPCLRFELGTIVSAPATANYPWRPDPHESGTRGSSQAPSHLWSLGCSSHLEATASSAPSRVAHPRSATASWAVNVQVTGVKEGLHCAPLAAVSRPRAGTRGLGEGRTWCSS